MNLGFDRIIWVVAAALMAVGSFVSRAAGSDWQTAGPGVRWAPLTVPAQGKAGFSLLPGAQTGITFTNFIDELAAASNRVLLNGSGVATGDFDNDGWPDIFFCSLNGRNTLYKNLGGWRFADVTTQCGLKRDQRFYRGAVFADLNGDGALDLLVAVLGGGVECFLNDGRGKFTDVTATARTGSPFGSSTLALADVDGNGTLDLYVANNRTDDIRDRGQVDLHLVNGRMVVPPALKDRLLVVNGQVLEYGEPDQLYLNDGKGRFSPVSWTGGRFRTEDGGPLTQAPLDWGLTATFRDINDDGFPDLYVCNDFWTPDRIWLNDGKGRFRAVQRLALRNTSSSSMGVDFADIDRDGLLDIFVVDMLSRDSRLRKRQKPAQEPMATPIGSIDDRPQFMRNTLFVNRGDGTFAEAANYAGLAASEWAWSPVFLDVDLDGFEDLLITTGHAHDVQDLDAQAKIQARQHSWKGFTNEAARQKAFTQELMEHMRLYPPLDTPIVAFRNRGDLHFEDVTSLWGTDQPGVHHAIAMADFDRDGDLDLVVNNLGSAAGLYRNEAAGGRVAVRLKGAPPNTGGIGAKVRLIGGATPLQSLEVISGGRYMAGSDPLLVFAAGNVSNEMTLEVTWRSGRRSGVSGVRPNQLYEIEEEKAPVIGQLSGADGANVQRRDPDHAVRTKLFTDVSQLLNHRHREETFDDFSEQPLLPFKLSQAGPGVAWCDLDGDGLDELFVGSGRGGVVAAFRVTGSGGFAPIPAPGIPPLAGDTAGMASWQDPSGQRALLVGLSGYENTAAPSALRFELTGGALREGGSWEGSASGSGALAVADFDGDGDLDVFVGGGVLIGRYPAAAPSRVYRCSGGRLELDADNSRQLANAGLVNGAVWSDLDGDGFAELILACDWGPVRVFKNEGGKLREATATMGMDSYTGWWKGVTTGDFDGDGRLDIVAANWGQNSAYQANVRTPLRLYYGDFAGRGTTDLIETEYDSATGALVPRRGLETLAASLPFLRGQFSSHKAFSEATVANVLGSRISAGKQVEVRTLESMVFVNRGNRFVPVTLPREAQVAPAFAVNVADLDGDGHEDLFLSQNFFATQPETPRLDGGRGLILLGDGTNRFVAMAGADSGIEIYGEQRGAALADFDRDGRVDLAVAQNGTGTKLFRNSSAKPGLRIRLKGPAGNPAGIGCVLRLHSGKDWGPAREIHGGSGYWSQDSASQVLARPRMADELIVVWPGGRRTRTSVPNEAAEITVGFEETVFAPPPR